MGASLSLAGCDDDYLYPVEYPVYDPDGGSDNGGGDEIPVPEKVNNKVVAHRGGSAEAGTAKYPDNSDRFAQLRHQSGVLRLGVRYLLDCRQQRRRRACRQRLLCEQPQAVGTHARRTACRGKLSNGELLPTLGGVYRRGAPCRNDAALARRETDRGRRCDLQHGRVGQGLLAGLRDHQGEEGPAFLRVHRFGQCRHLGGMLFRGPAGPASRSAG